MPLHFHSKLTLSHLGLLWHATMAAQEALLDFGAPFISTRRSTGSSCIARINSFNSTRTTAEESPRVPFKWERAAGVPKESVTRANNERRLSVPFPPKPPPGLRRLSRVERHSGRQRLPETHDDGNDGDIDRGEGSTNNDNQDEEVFADAFDRLSLEEESENACEANKCMAVTDIEPHGINRAPSFIMRRFLPAANALANSGATAKPPKYSNNKLSGAGSNPDYSRALRTKYSNHRAQTCHKETRAFREAKLPLGFVPPVKTPPRPSGSSKACGLVLLSPWSLNTRLCRFKSPVHCRTPASVRTRESLRDVLCNERSSAAAGGRRSHRDNGRVCEDRRLQSPGWGLQFLDTSRLRMFRKSLERKKDQKNSLNLKDGERDNKWSLHPLEPPSESWLSHAVISFSRGN